MTKKLKFFFIFNKQNIKKDFIFGLSLRKGIHYLLFLSYIYLIFFLITGLSSSINTLEVIIKFSIYSTLNFISFNNFVNSTKNFFYKDAQKALYFLNISIILHLIVFGFKILVFYFCKLKFSFLIFELNNAFDHSEYYELLFLIFEFYFYYIGYSYTEQLCQGNDALVDGQEYDKYIEDFGNHSDIRSSRSDNSIKRNNEFNNNNFNSKKNVNKNLYLSDLENHDDSIIN